MNSNERPFRWFPTHIFCSITNIFHCLVRKIIVSDDCDGGHKYMYGEERGREQCIPRTRWYEKSMRQAAKVLLEMNDFYVFSPETQSVASKPKAHTRHVSSRAALHIFAHPSNQIFRSDLPAAQGHNKTGKIQCTEQCSGNCALSARRIFFASSL